MARYHYRRNWVLRGILALAAIALIGYLAQLVYVWLTPWMPIIGAGILVLVFYWVGFRRRY